MRSLADRLGEKDKADLWGIAGLLHDADWEKTGETPDKHTHLVTQWIKEVEPDEELENAIYTHAWGYVKGNPEPATAIQWALYTCDELTGLIVATALVKPDRKLSSVTVESVMSKWDQKAFAKGVNREQIKMCEAKLNIPLGEFVQIALTAMQSIAPELGL